MKVIDARGLSCPEPVLRVQQALKASREDIAVLVDNIASVENIKRFAAARGYELCIRTDGNEYELTLTKQ